MADSSTGALFGAAGGVGEEANSYARYAAHAGAGCVSSAASGGSCGQGAASAVFGKYTTNAISGWGGDGTSGVIARGVATAVAGGVGSVIAGGKFANGAETAAFGYLFNELQHYNLGLKNSRANYLDDQFVPNIERWRELAKEQGIDLIFTEGYRTAHDQATVKGTGGVIPASLSLHQTGFAVDISIRGFSQQQLGLVVDLARQSGLSWGGNFRSNYDPYHFYRDPGGSRVNQARDAEIKYQKISGR